MQTINLDTLSNVTGGAGKAMALRDAVKLIKGGENVRNNFQGQYDLGRASGTIDRAVHGSEKVLDKARAWLGGSSVNARIDHMLSF